MRKVLTSLSIFLVCGMMFCPITEGQNRGRNGGGNSGNGGSPKTENRQSNNNSNRGNNKSQSNSGNRNSSPSVSQSSNRGRNNNVGNVNPGNNKQQGNLSQGNNRGNNNRGNVNPGNNRGNNNRGNVNPGGNRPGGNGGWNTHNPNRPGNVGAHAGHGHNFGYGAPMRPYMPARSRWMRPAPPRSFRPYVGCPSFSTILGITLGSALDYTLDRLVGAGYNVLSYAADAIYLSNVAMFNYTWPNATMYYTDGALHGSEFTYSTAGYDRSRYNVIYNDLVRQYGAPISVQNNGNNDITCTWWGADNRYVTLSYFADYATNGSLRYYTTLSFGN